jgi:hypothetical protein
VVFVFEEGFAGAHLSSPFARGVGFLFSCCLGLLSRAGELRGPRERREESNQEQQPQFPHGMIGQVSVFAHDDFEPAAVSTWKPNTGPKGDCEPSLAFACCKAELVSADETNSICDVFHSYIDAFSISIGCDAASTLRAAGTSRPNDA